MPTHDQDRAATDDSHRRVLEQVGAAELTPRPWQLEGQRVSDAELVRIAARKAGSPNVATEIVAAGLGLLASARDELDQIEAGLLFAARAEGMTFQQIAGALGLGSGQAAQQRMARLVGRLDQK